MSDEVVTTARDARGVATVTIDRPAVTVIVNPGGTNEKFDRANLRTARIMVVSSE